MSVFDLRAFWLTTANHLWLVGLVIGTLFVIDRAFLAKAPARYQGRLWTLALVTTCVPAAFVADLGRSVVPPWWSSSTMSTTQVMADSGWESLLRVDSFVSAVPQAAAPRPWMIVTVVWIGGAALLALGLVQRWRTLGALEGVNDSVVRRAAAVAARSAGIDPAVVRVVREAVLPHAGGVAQPTIVLPLALVRTLRERELGAVLVHESTHLQRRDPVWRWIQNLALVVFWYYPPAWLVLRQQNRAAEFDCDEAVARAGYDAATYLRAIEAAIRLGMSRPRIVPHSLLGITTSPLQARLHRIQHPPEARKMIVRSSIATTLALATVVVAFAAAPPVVGSPAGTQEPVRATESNRGDVLLNLRGVGIPTSVEFRDRSLREVFSMLAEVAGFEVVFVGLSDERLDNPSVRFTATNATVGSLLHSLRVNDVLTYEVTANDRLVVRPASTRIYMVDDDGVVTPGWIQGLGRGEHPEKPTVLQRVSPVYPASAQQARLQGAVIIRVLIGPEGRPQALTVLRGEHVELNEAATEAIRQWRWAPTIVDGEPVSAFATVTTMFGLPMNR
ncbi:MAG: TonB family protein [Acidobacteria bacterium]|nr:TonB family protein [Acidobacteriota bacterium]